MSSEKKYVETPLMKQYYSIKAVHPDAVLLFRVGDFYETFGEDAIKASAILGITLTRRANGAASYVELAGFPHHSIESYLPKLVRAGARVAICEQLEDPKSVKGLVKRGVVELVTPGVVLSENSLDSSANTFLGSVYFGRKSCGVALLDISTGEFYCAEGSESYIEKLISSFAPKEVIYQRSEDDRFRALFGSKLFTYKLDEWVFSLDVARENLCRQLGTTSLKGFGIESMPSSISAAGAILHYLDFTEHKDIAHIGRIARIDSDDYVWVDRFSIRNLELFATSNGSIKGSFVDVMDRTLTPMGSRLLKRWIALPIRSLERLKARQEMVGIFALDRDFSESVEEQISLIGDVERIGARVATGRVTPRELVQLKSSLEALSSLASLFEQSQYAALHHQAGLIEPLRELRDKLAREIYPDPKNNQIIKGGVIASGVDAELDDLRRVALHGKDLLQKIVERESAATGITSLKISFNNVFGYYIEVRNTHKDKVPEGWIRKQTLTSAERYITAELKEYEEKILGAEERMLAIEQRIYATLLDYIAQFIPALQLDAQIIARADCLLSFARIAVERRYSRPELDSSTTIEIKDGRHAVIETLLPVGEKYIPNDVLLNDQEQQIMMITGPNMSGKSALLRQTALIVLMAQIGSFVPASAARIGVVDKIFTRVGASDNISQGESTFMVEMLESANILNNISSHSIVLLDEIGRGTSTYDGISIAWSMVEYLHNHPKARAKTLFATHYHELNEMEHSCPRVKNYHVSVKETDGKIIFVRKLERGGTEHSFGIHVARMAGMPHSIVARASEILKNLEDASSAGEIATSPSSQAHTPQEGECSPIGEERHAGGDERHAGGEPRKSRGERVGQAVAQANAIQNMQLSMFQLDDPVLLEIRNQIRDLDLNNLTPLEALNTLNEIKKITGL